MKKLFGFDLRQSLKRFFDDTGLVFINEEDFIGVKIGKNFIKEMK
ncbi:hypothetical protein N9O56_00350 [Rickettsiales bacterium]|nr:hypothetical protein [Rickettsiales bacterium]